MPDYLLEPARGDRSLGRVPACGIARSRSRTPTPFPRRLDAGVGRPRPALRVDVRRVSLCLLLAACASPGERPPAAPTTARPVARPVVALLRHSEWFGAVDRPLFVLYDDGTAVFPMTRREWIPETYQSVRLDLSNRDRALASLGIAPSLYALRPTYDLAPNVTDQETVFLFVWRGDSLSRVAVRAPFDAEGGFRSGVPQPFRDAYNRLTRFEAQSAAPWSAPELEVSAWPYEYAPDDPPVPWPNTWPDLSSPGSACRPDAVVREVCTLRLPADQREPLKALLAKRRDRQAIGINGRKMAVGYRLVFPGDSVWRYALGRLEM